jgi:hypothetical protein
MENTNIQSQFAIFGLERMESPVEGDQNSGQPYFYRKYPQQYASFDKAQDELQNILNNKSPFPHYKFSSYVILEIFSGAKN